MIGKLLVSPEQMKTAAGELTEYVNQMQECFESMRRTVEGSSSYWQGDAGEAHRELYTKRVAKTEEIIRRYQEHIRDLNEMAGVYSEAERKAADAAESLPASSL